MEFPSGVAVLHGDNAQGKTSLLEAVYLLAIARSFRTDNEREVVNFGAAKVGGMALVSGLLDRNGERVSINIGYQCVTRASRLRPGGASNAPSGYSVRKQIRVNRRRRTAAELVGVIGAVLFNAEDIELAQGAPGGRRRWLNILISQSNPLYLQALQRYQKVLQQRNRLLRLLREGRAETGELEFWDERLVADGSQLTWQRSEAIKLLAALCAQQHRQLSNPGETLTLGYRPNAPLGESLAATEAGYREVLTRQRPRDLGAGSTTVGPHRDDFKLWVDDVDMGVYASRGQARTLALALRLAEADYLTELRDDEPIILLDDVLSEIDADRRRRVLEKISGYRQSLITTTDLEPPLNFFGSTATYMSVKGGGVKGDPQEPSAAPL